MVGTIRLTYCLVVLLLAAGGLTAFGAGKPAPRVEHRHAAHPPSTMHSILSPLSWHRERWRKHRQRDPSFVIELPKSLFDAYAPGGYAPEPGVPPRPAPVVPRERGEIWRDDVVGSGSGGRIEVHPEGRILRSRPRSD